MKPYIVTGCGRSGTGYMAQVLTSAHVPCGHERLFQGKGDAKLEPDSVDSSWFAAPFVRDRDAMVIHQVREPMAVVSSWLANRSMRSQFVVRFLLKWCPRPLTEPDPASAVLQYWVQWNRMVEYHANYRWQVETITREDIYDSLILSGRDVNKSSIGSALGSTSSITNRKESDVPKVTWNDIKNKEVRKEAEKLASKYGYEL